MDMRHLEKIKILKVPFSINLMYLNVTLVPLNHEKTMHDLFAVA